MSINVCLLFLILNISLFVSELYIPTLLLHTLYRSSDFRPCYAHLSELRAYAPPGTPMLAATATVTDKMRRQIVKTLDMLGCHVVNVSPNKPNIFYRVERRTADMDKDLAFLTSDLLVNNIKAKRTIVYCQSLDMCANLYIHFHSKLGNASYFPLEASQVSDNRLFGMFHSKTDDYNKLVILNSLSKPEGTVRIVFATMALGMGVDFRGLTCTIHYGAPRSLEDYFQESGRRTIYFHHILVPRRCSQQEKRKDNPHNVELDTVREYLTTTDCWRHYLLKYFDPCLTYQLKSRDLDQCCDNCKARS